MILLFTGDFKINWSYSSNCFKVYSKIYFIIFNPFATEFFGLVFFVIVFFTRLICLSGISKVMSAVITSPNKRTVFAAILYKNNRY